MSDNEEPGPSKHMSVEELARDANKTFWEMSQELEEEVEAAEPVSGGDGVDDEQEDREDDEETSDGAPSGGQEDDTTDGGDYLDGGTGSNPTAQKQRRQRRDRTPQVLANVTDVFTEVTPSGLPVEPKELAKGYSMQLGCIVRESMSINTKDLRSKANEALVELLLKKLHQRYTFPEPFNKKVDSLAITKMSKALSSWKSRVKKKIDKGESWEKISSKEPTLDEEEFEAFKLSIKSEVSKKWTKWGKQMQKLNIGKHHLGSGGYRGKQPTWDKEDAEIARMGKENPWHKITDEQVRNFVRSRYYLDKVTGEFVTDDDDVRAFEKVLEDELKVDTEAVTSSQGSTELWDTTFNRAMNVYKGRDKMARPTSAGRVTGFGTSMKFLEYYSTDAETRKEKRKSAKDSVEVMELRKKVETLQQDKVDSSMVDKLVEEKIREFLPPGLMEGLAAWNAAGRHGPIHLPSYAGSNSSNNVSPDLVTPLPNTAAQPLHHLVPPTSPTAAQPVAAAMNDRPAAGTGALVSTLADLNAITKDMPCILLHRVGANDELKEVAQGTVIQPKSRDMHNTKMREAMMKVVVDRVVPEFGDIDPPTQPPGAEEEHMVLRNCVKWIMEWPKTQIRLGEGLQGLRRTTGATSRPPISRPSKPPQKPVGKEPAPQEAVATIQKELPVVATTSRHQKLLGTYVPPQRPSKANDVAPQLGDNGDDDGEDNINVDDFLNTGAIKDFFMPPMDEEPFRAHSDPIGHPPTCNQRLNFQGLSQYVPPEAGNQDIQGLSQHTPPEAGNQGNPANVFTPGTLKQTVRDGLTHLASPEMKKKKHRKRSRRGVSIFSHSVSRR